MGFNDFLKSIFGNKSQRDLREIQPIVDQINRIYPTLAELSNDELRERVAKIKEALAESTADKKHSNTRNANPIGKKSTESRKKYSKRSKKSSTSICPKYSPSSAKQHGDSKKMKQSKSQPAISTANWQQKEKTFFPSKATKPYTATIGWPAAMKSHGTWYTTTCNSSEVSSCIKEKSRRWQPAKVKRSWLRSPCS